MDLGEFREILSNSRVNIWAFIETAIELASIDYSNEFHGRRDSIVEKLYRNCCPNCDSSNSSVVEVSRLNEKANHSPYTPAYVNGDAYDLESLRNDDFVDDDDDEKSRVLSIKEQIEDPDQGEDALLDLLQTLADMDITFRALKDTDIGRHVNRLRKHPSNDVRQLVKQLVRKWKDLVDDWVKFHPPGEVQSSSNLIVDGDSPQQNVSRNHQGGHHSQVPDFAYSPNPHYAGSSWDKNHMESDSRPKIAGVAALAPRKNLYTKSPSAPTSAPPPNRHTEVAIDPDRLASARRRLQENYQEAQNAKKQRTIQVMDIHEIPKPKNGFFGRNKGGFQRH